MEYQTGQYDMERRIRMRPKLHTGALQEKRKEASPIL
jgi:hypothetical protein